MADTENLDSAKSSGIKLDWSRLLGFDQATQRVDDAAATDISDPRLAKLGAKIGRKLSRGR